MHGLSFLGTWSSRIQCVRDHARWMASHRLAHSACDVDGEIVGYGPGIHSIVRAWLDSDAHREIMLCRCFRKVAVGIFDDGRIVYIAAGFELK